MADDKVKSKVSTAIEDDKGKSRVSIMHEKTKSHASSLLKSNHSMPSKSTNALGARTMSRLKVRKQSYGFSTISGITPLARSSALGLEYKRPVCTYLNTYQLDPRVKFDPIPVKKATQVLLDEMFTDHVYSAQGSPALALRLADELLRNVKAMNFNRYRILSLVTIAQDRSQSYHNAVAFIWDHERDNYINIQREVRTAFIQVTVFGIYFD